MPLQTGDAAPDFTLYDSDQEPFTLSNELDNGPVALFFFPGAFTSVCSTELNTVANDIGSYEGAQIVGISTDAPAALGEFKKVNQFPFRLLSDHDAEVAAAFGAKHDHDFGVMKLDRIARRSVFVIDRDGRVRYSEITANPGVQPDFDAVKQAIADLG